MALAYTRQTGRWSRLRGFSVARALSAACPPGGPLTPLLPAQPIDPSPTLGARFGAPSGAQLGGAARLPWLSLLVVWAIAALVSGCMPGKRDNEVWTPPKVKDAGGDSGGAKDASSADADGSGTETDGAAANDTATDDTATDDADDVALIDAPADGDTGDVAADSAVIGIPGCVTDSQCAALPFGPCASGRCDLATGLCQGENAADGTACGGDACTSKATCKAGKCGGVPLPCSDGNSCTADSCDPQKGCDHKLLQQILCDDGQKCTPVDLCVAGQCVGEAMVCEDGDPCTDDTCNAASGQCNHLGFASSAKKVACTASGGCLGPGQCEAGVCLAKSLCDDGNPCTFDLCAAGNCSHLARSGACTPAGAKSGDLCAKGLCLSGDGSDWQPGGALPVCVAQAACAAKECLVGKCDPASGQCSYPTKLDDQSPCSATSLCTTAGKCVLGQCKTAAVACDDGNPCTQESCDPAVGCKGKAKADGGPCDDGNGCTKTDSCSGGKCAGKAISCDDGNACTADSCDPAGGCVHGAEADGAACPGGACKGGQCGN